jgi:dihydroxyacetone kinase
MDLQINIELRGRVLLVTASGRVTLDAALRLLKQAFDEAKEKEVKKILVNALAIEGALSTFERYRLAIGVVAYLKQRGMNPRLAFVGKLPTTDGFGVRVAQNRDVTAGTFSSPQEALDWLDKWPS